MTASPLFLLATERSGSNLLRSILDTHSDVSAPHPFGTGFFHTGNIAPPSQLSARKASRFIRDAIIEKENARTTNPLSPDPGKVYRRLERDSDSALAYERALNEEYAAIEGSSYWCNKNPTLAKNVGEVIEYYDDPYFIYLVRDPRDVILSYKKSTVGDYHPVLNARRWRREQANVLSHKERIPDRFDLVKYEDILREPERSVKALCEGIGLDYEPEMLEFYKTDRARRHSARSTEIHGNLDKPVQKDNYAKYKDELPAEEIRIVEQIAIDEMAELGYEIEFEPGATDIEIDEAGVSKRNAIMNRKMNRESWKSNPGENFHNLLSASFKRYVFLRYGLLEGRNITGR